MLSVSLKVIFLIFAPLYSQSVWPLNALNVETVGLLNLTFADLSCQSVWRSPSPVCACRVKPLYSVSSLRSARPSVAISSPDAPYALNGKSASLKR